ncbi:MAG: tRNA (guanosine(46)-N7)-methyltransferase TrmB [Eubacteriales bacterium]|nr:tRNA (guanosine(46)-N7)-methyltransferase TrmB [Eubacteriales bacterium]MDY3332710.1 tRNA (guanosine(46)-N7)-methyltransferase TrmB [Gallibacter sp.]
MRQRRLKNLETRKNNVSRQFLDNPKALKGKWTAFFEEKNGKKNADLFLEIGCGKGGFITTLAKNNPDNNYIALEGQESVVVLAMEKARDLELDNIVFISEYMEDICDYFKPDELNGIYLNFSDPWPKKKHEKRRLTHRRLLQKYRKIITPNGFLQFKTDNDPLFEFSVDELNFLGYRINEITRDLYSSDYIKGNVPTEYETKFHNRGKNINYFRIFFGGDNMILAQQNAREIPQGDITFVLNTRAKEMIEEKGKDAVVNATIGVLLDDSGSLATMDCVLDEMKTLDASDYFEYAPIGGIPAYKETVKNEILRGFNSERFLEVVATPGGTGAIRNTISNYSKVGDKVLTSDWYWGPYKSLCEEQQRKLDTFELFDAHNDFNLRGLTEKIYKLAKEQESLVILMNTPAHNPTGYSLHEDDWNALIDVLNDEQLDQVPIALFVDIAYIDFAGDPDEVRHFLPKLERLNENILPIIGYSASKTYAAYGTRTGAMMCMAKTEAIAEEFKRVCEYSSRNTWSNCNRAGQQMIANIASNSAKYKIVEQERTEFRDMLLKRGRIFEEECKKLNLPMVPFNSGFFACIECENSMEVAEKLASYGVFVIPLKKGIRISVASISEEKCIITANKIAEVL